MTSPTLPVIDLDGGVLDPAVPGAFDVTASLDEALPSPEISGRFVPTACTTPATDCVPMVVTSEAIIAPYQVSTKPGLECNDDTLSAEDMALEYKQLQRVEQAWRQPKSGLRLRPVYHRAVHGIHAHIALLLERMAEHACADTWRNIRDDLKGIQLAQLIGPNGTIWQVTELRPSASNRLNLLQIDPPPPILKLA